MPGTIQPLFSAPVGEIIFQIGKEIAVARANLEAYSFSIERQIEQIKDKIGAGLSAPWLHLPEIEIEMPVALNYLGQRPEENKPGIRSLHAAPINPTFSNFFNFKGEAATKIKMTFRSTPSP